MVVVVVVVMVMLKSGSPLSSRLGLGRWGGWLMAGLGRGRGWGGRWRLIRLDGFSRWRLIRLDGLIRWGGRWIGRWGVWNLGWIEDIERGFMVLGRICGWWVWWYGYDLKWIYDLKWNDCSLVDFEFGWDSLDLMICLLYMWGYVEYHMARTLNRNLMETITLYLTLEGSLSYMVVSLYIYILVAHEPIYVPYLIPVRDNYTRTFVSPTELLCSLSLSL